MPPTLKQLAPILKHASQLRGQVPVMSYLCSLYAVQLGLKVKGNDPASKTFLFGLMDRLEQHRAELGSALSQIPDQKVTYRPTHSQSWEHQNTRSKLHVEGLK